MTNEEILKSQKIIKYQSYFEKAMDAAREDEAVGVLQSLRSDLNGFKEMKLLTPDIKKGLDIAIEQIGRYQRGDIIKHKNEKL